MANQGSSGAASETNEVDHAELACGQRWRWGVRSRLRGWGRFFLLFLCILVGPAEAQFSSPAFFVVNSSADASDRNLVDPACSTGVTVTLPSGPQPECTFRAALEQINATASLGWIDFAPDLFSSSNPFLTLLPATPYPPIDKPVAIRGESAPTYDAATPFSVPAVQILGTSIRGSTASGLQFTAGANGSYVGAIAVAGFLGDGISSLGTNGLVIQGCDIGVYRGSLVFGNGLAGIRADRMSTATFIGMTGGLGSFPFEPLEKGNLISGNGAHGIALEGSLARVLGNRIGTDRTGTSIEPIPGRVYSNQSWGLLIDGVDISIGTLESLGTDPLVTAGGENLISGNEAGGISVGPSADDVLIVGNRIGTDALGANGLGNGFGPGVLIAGPSVTLGADTPPGDPTALNQIAGHASDGVQILPGGDATISGNWIGVAEDGTSAISNQGHGVRALAGGLLTAFEGNVISGNDGDGLYVELAQNLRIADNRIGLTPNGDAVLPNGGDGIHFVGGTVGLVVEGNAIGGNSGDGIHGLGDGSFVEGNQIGVAPDGESAMANGGDGIELATGSAGVLIQLNVIGANQGHGITGTADGNVIRANEIGVSPTGADLGNLGSGIELEGVDNRIGSTMPFGGPGGEGNRIGYNGDAGVRIFQPAIETGIRGNSIFENGGLGIDLGFASQGLSVAAQLIEGQSFLDPVTGEIEVTYAFLLGPPIVSSQVAVDFYVADSSGAEPAHLIGSDSIPAPYPPVTRTFTFQPVAGVPIGYGTRILALATDSELDTVEASNSVPLPEPSLTVSVWLGAALLFARRRRLRRS